MLFRSGNDKSSMSYSIGIRKRNLSKSIEFGKSKMSLSVGIGKRNQKPYYIQMHWGNTAFIIPKSDLHLVLINIALC